MPKHAIRTFAGGCHDDPISWLTHYRRVARVNGWKTDESLLWNIGIAFNGPAEVWYTSIESWSLEPGRTWADFEVAFLRRFKPSNYNELLENTIRSIAQAETEDIATYAGRFRLLHGRLPTTGPTLDSLRYCWINGLARNDWKAVLLTKAPQTFEAAQAKALAMEHGDAMMRATAVGAEMPVLEGASVAEAGNGIQSRVPFEDLSSMQTLTDVFSQMLQIAQSRQVDSQQSARTGAAGGQGAEKERKAPSRPVQRENRTAGRQYGQEIICYHCREPGHIAARCPNRVVTQAPVERSDQPQSGQQVDIFMARKKKRARDRGHSDPGEGTKQRRRRRGAKRHIKMVKSPEVKEYSVVKDLSSAKANVSYAQLLDMVPALRKELKSGLALQPIAPVPLDQATREAFGRREPDVEMRDVPGPSNKPVREIASNLAQAGSVNLGAVTAEEESASSIAVRAEVDGQLVATVIIDGGSGINVMTWDTYASLALPDLESCNVVINVADGRQSNAVGKFQGRVSVMGVVVLVTIYVIDDKTGFDMILGVPWLRKVGAVNDWDSGRHTIKGRDGEIIHLERNDCLSESDSDADDDSSSGSSETDDDYSVDDGHSEEVSVYWMNKMGDSSNQVQEEQLAELQYSDVGGGKEFDINPELPDAAISEMRAVLEEFDDVFARKLSDLKQTDAITCEIVMRPGAQPVCCKQIRRYSPEEQKACYDQLMELEAAGLIQEDRGPYGANLVFARKKNNELRMCINYVKLNQRTEKAVWPIPNLESCCETLCGSQYYSVLDGFRGYYCVKMEPKSIEKTAFFTPYGKFAWRCMPFGLQGAPSVYAQLQQVTLGKLMAKNSDSAAVANFFDDTGIGTKTWSEHVNLLKQVLQALREKNISLNPKKCRFGYESVKFLGFVLDREGIHADPAKVDAIKQWKRPQNEKGIMAFLGVAGFYRKLISGFARLASPLTNLLKKSVEFCWNSETEAAFRGLKEALCTNQVLAKPQYGRTWYISVDASQNCIGAALNQEDDSGEMRPVYFLSRKMAAAELNYATVEKELLGIVVALKKFRHYIQGQEVKVLTDHKPLLWLVKQDELSGRLARWTTLISEYGIQIAHIPGKKNVVADALSRPEGGCEAREPRYSDDEFNVFLIGQAEWPDHLLQYLATGQFHESATDLEKRRIKRKLGSFQLIDGKLYKRDEVNGPLLYIREGKQREVIVHHAHQNGHFGLKKTVCRILEQYWWPTVYSDVQRYLKTCEICQKLDPVRMLHQPGELTVIQPFEVLAVDFVGPLPITVNQNRYLLCGLDLCTRWLEAVPTRDCKAETVIQFLKDTLIPRFGNPACLLSDNAQSFVGRKMSDFLQRRKIRQITSAAFTPKSNGAVERYNKTIVGVLRARLMGKTLWDEEIGEALLSVRTAQHGVLQQSPAQLLMGYQPSQLKSGMPDSFRQSVLKLGAEESKLSVSVKDEVVTRQQQLIEMRSAADFRDVQAKLKRRADPRFEEKHPDYQIGELVLIYDVTRKTRKASKFDPLWTGPYAVVGKEARDIWSVGSVGGRTLFRIHSDRLKRFQS